MTVYVIAQVKFTDEARYRKYQAKFFDVFKDSGGKLLAADEKPSVLEGEWRSNKVVVMAFADEQQAVDRAQEIGDRLGEEERARIANRVARLDPRHVDPDLADELIRKELNVGHPDEVVVPLH